MKTNTLIRLPKDTQHIAVIGRTGTGKTQAGVWHLSKQNFSTFPRIIFDFKGDELINSITRAKEITLNELPKQPGIYILHPIPADIDNGLVENYLWRIYERERIGLFIDEGYMMGRSKAFETLLTQGRSKQIPMIVLSQRPCWITRFVWSESSFFQVFHLNNKQDKKTVEDFVPVNMDTRLPDFHSWYYDVGEDRVLPLKPVPSADEILVSIDKKLEALEERSKKVIRKI